ANRAGQERAPDNRSLGADALVVEDVEYPAVRRHAKSARIPVRGDETAEIQAPALDGADGDGIVAAVSHIKGPAIGTHRDGVWAAAERQIGSETDRKGLDDPLTARVDDRYGIVVRVRDVERRTVGAE